MRLRHDDPVASALFRAIHDGDIETVQALCQDHPGLAAAEIGDPRGGTRTPLMAAADWPGFFPNGAQVVAALIAAGGDPNARGSDPSGAPGAEGPLHWAASSDDAEVAAALIDGGAILEAPGGSIGTPLANAVGYGCWQVADLLVARGAKVEPLWAAAALGVMSAVERFFAATPAPTRDELNHAFWQACHGGQPRAAARLLARGADPSWVPDYAHKTALEVAKDAQGGGTRWGIVADWLERRKEKPR